MHQNAPFELGPCSARRPPRPALPSFMPAGGGVLVNGAGAQASGRAAVVTLDPSAGRVETPCRVVGETPKRYRIEVDEPTRMPARASILWPGISKLVPKDTVRFLAPERDASVPYDGQAGFGEAEEPIA